MNKLKRMKVGKPLLLVLSFIIPIIIAAIGFTFCLKQSKSGNLNIGYGDLQVQYTALFSYIQNILNGTESITYTFSKGLGGGMISTFAYYLMSPLNLLIGLVSASNVPIMLLTIIILKIGLAGLCSYIFLSYFFKKKDYRLLIFSTCYALSAYAINFHFCIMWLDALYMLPLILLGLRRLVEGKSPIMYIICLVYTIFCNYYIGYMICIFVCIYFLFEIIMKKIYKNKKELIKISLKFVISSLLSGMLCMILLIPTLKDLSNTARSIGNYEGRYTLNSVENNFGFLHLIYRFLIGSHEEMMVADYTAINAYCGLIILPLLYFYFINKDIDKKEKIFSSGVIILYLLSYSVKYVDYMWHGFAFPNGLNYRFAFLFIFYFIIMACHSFLKIKSIPKKHYFIFYTSFLILMNLLMFNGYMDKYIIIYVSVICVALYLIIMYVMHHIKLNKLQKIEVPAILVTLVASELLFNIYFCLDDYFEYTQKEYNDYVEIYSEKIDKYKSKENEFYRMNQDEYFVANPGLMFDYNGMVSFLSTMNTRDLKFLTLNGYMTSELSLLYTSNSHYLMDSILGVKYFISSGDCGAYEKVDSFEYSEFSGLMYNIMKGEVSICENNIAMPLGFMIDKNWNKYGSDIEAFNYLAVSESIVNSMIKESYSYYEPYEFTRVGNYEYNVKVDDRERFYITYMLYDLPQNFRVYVNDELMYSSEYPSMFISIENKYKGETVNVRFELDNPSQDPVVNVEFLGENTDNIYNAINELKENAFTIEKFTDTYIKGTVTATEEKNTLFFSIPYEKGWQVYVDGKKTSYKALYDAFVGIELDKGEHEIELKYSVPGLKLGACISSISLIITIIYLYMERKSEKKVK